MRNKQTLNPVNLNDGSASTRSVFSQVILAFTLFSFIAQPVLAAGPIVADPNAAAAQRPTVQTTANGLPVVNIAAPNSAGVSHNKYNQFNVNSNGAVLNNAQAMTNTQLAGYVDGNPNLAGGSARTILNEVTSGNPSALRGYLEVAGSKANVIIANPNGISCDGCGFINSSRTTLTTGTPVFGGSGSLDAFRVSGGMISVSGAGFNGNNLDQVDLIARAVQINANVYAKQLNVIAGANTVNYADLGTQTIAGDANTPAVSIDVAQLGGMYADKIHLVGTEAGVGVNLGGTTAVSGQLQIDSAGKLTHSGQTSAGSVSLNAGSDVVNSGQLYSAGNLDAHVTGQLSNTGTLGAAQDVNLQAGSLNQQGTLAAGLNAQGQVQGNGALAMTTSGATTLGGQTVAAANLTAQAGSLNANAQVQSGAGLTLTATQGDLTLNGATVSAGSTLSTTAAGNLATRNATLSAQQLSLAGSNIDNTGGKLVQTGSGTMQVTTAGTLTNQGGLVGSAGGMSLNAGTIDNSNGGQLQADRFSLIANTLKNQHGTLQQTGTADGQFAIASLLDNRNGTFATNAQNLALNTSQINNGNGTLSLAGNGTLSLVGTVDNTQGKVLGNGNVQINAPSLTNTSGQIVAQGGLALSGRDIDNTSGALGAGGAVTVNNTGTVTNTNGDIEAGQGLTLQAASLNNAGTGRVVAVAGDTSVTTTGILTNAGTLGGNGQVTLRAATLDNSGKLTAGGDLKAQAGNISNAGTAVASNLLQLHATQTLGNSNGKLQGQQLDLAALTLVNAHGQIVQTGSGTGNWQITQLLDNRNGSIISAAQDLDLNSATIRNGAGTIGHAGSGTLSLEGDVDNSAGQINGNGDISISQGQLVNQGGTVGAQQGLTVTASSIDNTAAGVLTAKSAVTLGATGTLDNSNGTVEAGNGLTVSAQTLTNNGTGRLVAITGDAGITATGTLTNAGLIGGNGKTTVQAVQTTNSGTLTAGTALSVTGSALTNSGSLQGADTTVQMSTANGGSGVINNQHGNINGAGTLTVAAASLDNTSGHVTNSGTGQSTVTVTSALTNTSGLVGGNGATSISASSISNDQGTLTSGGALGVTVTTTLNNQSGTVYAVGNSTIQAATLDNTSGTLNGHGDVGVNATTTNNGSGRVASDHNITLTSNTLNGLGNITAGNDLGLNLQGDVTYTNGQNWTANHDFNLTTTGGITNLGNLGAVGTLTLNGTGLTNAAGAQLSGNTGLTVHTGGTILNNGVMFGDQVNLNAGAITNANAIFGGNVTLNAGQINNSGTGVNDSAIIAAGRTLNLYTGSLNNTGGGDLYSMGDLNIAAQDGSSNAAGVLNQSSTIQGDGNVSIHSASLSNRWDSIQSSSTSSSTSSTATVSTQPPVDPNIPPWQVPTPDDGSSYTVTTITTVTTTDLATASGTGRAGQILAGQNLTLSGGTVDNDASLISAGGNFGFDTAGVANHSYDAWTRVTQSTSGAQTTFVYHAAGSGGAGGGGGGDGHPAEWTHTTANLPETTTPISNDPQPGLSAVLSANGSITGNPGSVSNITVNAHNTGVSGSTVDASNAPRISGAISNQAVGAVVGVAVADNSSQAVSGRVGVITGQPLKGNPVGTGYQLPTSGLYKINTQPNQNYLVETDPRFTQYGNFISSDYMLQKLGLDPAATEKRLGDAFYENKLITDQVAQLTGQRFLDGYTDQSAEYTALMNAGATYAQQFGIAPGIALSADQMASLTQDMVWLENRVVDGQNVLVPVVYLSSVKQNAMQSGDATIAANSIDLHTGTLTNTGVIQSNTSTVIAATTLSNLGGQITSLGDVQLSASGDLLNQSGLISGNKVTLSAGNNLSNITVPGQTVATIKAGDSLVLTAGHDLTITAGNISATGDAQIGAGHDLIVNTLATTTTNTQTGTDRGDGWYLQDGTKTTTSQTTNQTSSITSGGSLTMTAGNDATLTGAQVKADKNLSLVAGGNVTVQAATDSSAYDQTKGGDRYHHNETHEQLVGSQLSAGQDVTIQSGSTTPGAAAANLNITSSSVLSDNGHIKLAATGDVNIGTQTETDTSLTTTHTRSSGFFSSTDTRTRDQSSSTTRLGSSISGDSVEVNAGKNLNVIGSSVVGSGDVSLSAGKDVTIAAATDTSETDQYRHQSKSGIFTSGLSVTFGKQESTDELVSSSVTQSQSRSQVGSIAGNVTIKAGGDTTVQGSDVSALKGDLGITAQNINIISSADDLQTDQSHQQKQSGLSLNVVNTPLDTVRNLKDTTKGGGYGAIHGVGTELLSSALDAPAVDVSYGRSESGNQSHTISSTASGATLTAGGNIKLTATGSAPDANGQRTGGDINVAGSVVQATGNLNLDANGNVNIATSTDSTQTASSAYDNATKVSAYGPQWGDLVRGLSGGPNNANTSLSAYNQGRNSDDAGNSSSSQKSSLINGGTVTVTSHTGDINVVSSAVNGTYGVDLEANKGNINVVSSNNQSDSHDSSNALTIGDLGGTGNSTTVGVRHASDSIKDTANSQSTIRSQITSGSGDVTMIAQNNIHIAGADVNAGNDINLSGTSVQIDPGVDKRTHDESHSTSQMGITATVSSPLQSAEQTIVTVAHAGKDSGDARTKALAAGTAALAAYNVASAIESNPENAASVSGSITFGASHSQSTSTSQSTTNFGSTLNAGHDITIYATGGEKASNINIIGSDLSAGHDITLLADNQVNLLAAQDLSTQHSQNSGSGWGVGVAFNVGANGISYGITANAQASKGHTDGTDVTWQNTHVTANNNLNITSGGDTNLVGAVAKGEQVSADVGGDLNIQSLQDTSTYDSKQQNISGSVTVGVGYSGSLSYSQQQLHNDYASVNEQSGIKAGDSGFQLNVTGNTDLKGGVIASTADASKNSLSTGSLTHSDIDNHADYSGNSVSLGMSGTVGGSGSPNKVGPATEINYGPNGSVSAAPPVALSASGSDSGTTHSAISAGTITITNADQQKTLTGQTADEAVAGISRDTADAQNSVKNDFDPKKINDALVVTSALITQVGQFEAQKSSEVDEKMAKAKAADRAAADPTSDLTDEQRQSLRDQAEALRSQASNISETWGPGSPSRQVLTALLAATGNVTSSASNFATTGLVNYIQQQGASFIGDLVAKGELEEGSPAHAALHALVACAGAAASNQNCTAGAISAATSSLLTNLFSDDPNLSESEQESRRNLVSTLIAGIATATDANSANTAVTAAVAAQDNNWLATQQKVQMNKELSKATSTLDKLKVLGKWAGVSAKQDFLTAGGIGKGLSEGFGGDVAGLAEFLSDPLKGVEGLKQLVDSPQAREQFGDALCKSLDDQITRMKTEIEFGGDSNAEQLGKDLGNLVWQVGSLATGVDGVAKAGTKLAEVGVNLGTKILEAMKGTASLLNSQAKGLGGVVSLGETGMEFGAGIVKQGKPFEAYVQSKLPAGTLDLNTIKSNFSTFDHLTPDGVAISDKTLDTGLSGYTKNPTSITSTLNAYVRDMVNFEKDGNEVFNLTNAEITAKQMQLAIPYNASAEQMAAIARSIEYAKNRGVQIIVTKVK